MNDSDKRGAIEAQKIRTWSYFYNKMIREAGMDPSEFVYKTDTDPIITFIGRRIVIPEFSRENNLPGILGMFGPRDEQLTRVVNAVSDLRKSKPFCTYDAQGFGSALPVYEWPQIDFPKRSRLVYLGTVGVSPRLLE